MGANRPCPIHLGVSRSCPLHGGIKSVVPIMSLSVPIFPRESGWGLTCWSISPIKNQRLDVHCDPLYLWGCNKIKQTQSNGCTLLQPRGTPYNMSLGIRSSRTVYWTRLTVQIAKRAFSPYKDSRIDADNSGAHIILQICPNFLSLRSILLERS